MSDSVVEALKCLGVATEGVDWADTQLLGELNASLKMVAVTDTDRLNVLRAAVEGLPTHREKMSRRSGARINGVIGVVRICDFGTLSLVLQSQIMVLLNDIAEILHAILHEHPDVTVKNFGDTFLFVWPVQADGSEVADKAVLDFARLLSVVQRSPTLARYRVHPGLQQRLGSKYHVQLACGIHFGWVIQGTVGVDSRIDMSYVSPNVNIATDVANATQIYGVPLLASQDFVQRCSPKMAEKCRAVDRVLTTNSVDPMELYSIDLELHNLDVDAQSDDATSRMSLIGGVDTVSLFESDSHIVAMRQRYTVEFTQAFQMAYQNYKAGEWQVARQWLIRVQSLDATDGPAKALLRFMGESFDFQEPLGWQGVRDLSGGVASGNLCSFR